MIFHMKKQKQNMSILLGLLDFQVHKMKRWNYRFWMTPNIVMHYRSVIFCSLNHFRFAFVFNVFQTHRTKQHIGRLLYSKPVFVIRVTNQISAVRNL